MKVPPRILCPVVVTLFCSVIQVHDIQYDIPLFYFLVVLRLNYREKPHDDEWERLDAMKIPFLSNYSQCMLYAGEYYKVIEHTTEVLKREPGSV